MAEYYKIKIENADGAVWFTTDGTEDGDGCAVEIAGLDELLDKIGNSSVAASGKPKTEFPLNEGRGIAVELKFRSVLYSKHEALKTIFDGGLPFEFAGFGLPGNFEIGAVPNYAPTPISVGNAHQTTRIKNYVVRILTDDLPE